MVRAQARNYRAGGGGREVVEVSPALFRENALIVVIYG